MIRQLLSALFGGFILLFALNETVFATESTVPSRGALTGIITDTETAPTCRCYRHRYRYRGEIQAVKSAIRYDKTPFIIKKGLLIVDQYQVN